MRNPSDLPRSPRNPRTPGGGFRIGNFRKARSIWSAVLAVFVVGGISARSLANFYVNILWHDVVGRTDVFWGVLTTQLSLAAVFVTIFSLAILLNLWLADRLAPSDVPISLEQRALAGYRQLVAKRQWLVRVVISFVLGLLVGLPASSQWQDWLLFKNAQSFDIKDPLFDRDVSFYIFKLPFIQFLIGWSLAALILIALVTAIAHYLNGAIQLQTQGRHVTPQAKAHLSVLFAADRQRDHRHTLRAIHDLTRRPTHFNQSCLVGDSGAGSPMAAASPLAGFTGGRLAPKRADKLRIMTKKTGTTN